MAITHFSSPNYLPRYPAVVMVSMIFCLINVLLNLAVLVVYTMEVPRCTDDNKQSDDSWRMFHNALLYIQVVWCIILVVPYFIFIMSCRYIFKIRKQSKCDHNRAKLAFSVPGLCKAQKRRIEKSGFAVDAFVLLLATFCTITRFVIFDQCDLKIECSMPCRYQPYLPALPFYFACALGSVLKTCIMAPEYDYSPVSQEMEAYLLNQKSWNPFQWWVRSAEKCQAVVMPIWLAGTVIIVLLMVYIEIQPSYDIAFEICGILEWTFGSLLLIIDGCIVRVLWAIMIRVSRVFQSTKSREKGPRMSDVLSDSKVVRVKVSKFRSPLKMRSLPKRKAIMGLSLMVWILCLTSMTGTDVDAHDIRTQITYIILFVCSVCLLVCIFLTSDREISVTDLLQMSANDNFGLVMSRIAMVKELQRIVSAGSSDIRLPKKITDVNIPTFLASQARVELAVVVSYRWSDEKLYKDSGQAVERCFRLRNASARALTGLRR